MRWTRRNLLRTVGAAGLVGCRQPDGVRPEPGTTPVDSGTSPPARPANIVYIYSDQHRAPILGCYGHPIVQTPNLDALAAESVLFPNMFTNSPLCRPARATMMTGRMPHLHGCWNNEQLASTTGPSHVRRLRDEAGYHTALIGKAHLTLPAGSPMEPANVAKMEAWGFEYTLELLSQIVCADKPNPYSEWLQQITPAGERSKADRYAQYVVAWELLGFPPPDAEPYALGTDDHVDLWCGDLAAEWIRTVADDRPFYLQVAFPGPHSPYDAPTEFRALYDASAPAFPTAILGAPQAPMSPLVTFLYTWRPELHGLTATDSRDLLLTYFAKVTLIDRAVGTVMSALAERGLLENTWVVYGSDHGDLLGDHELWGKIAMYEGALRTPLVVRPPGGISPWVSEGKVDQVDVTATLLEIAGLVPDGTGLGRRDQCLAGADAPGAQEGKDSIVAEVEGHPGTGLRTGMVRRDRYKLAYDFERDRPVELYDLEADPEERTNRILDPALAPTIGDLRDELLSTIEAEVNAG